MKRICFITSGMLPVPAIKGGAIEQLIQQLCEDNEKNPHFDLTVITQKDPMAVAAQQFYPHTHFINYVQWRGLYYKLAWKARGMMRRLTRHAYPQFHTYEYQVLQYIKRERGEFDLIIAEGCDMELMYCISRLVGKDRVCLHLHCEFFANEQCDNSFGHLIGVSNFVRKAYLSTSKAMNESKSHVLLNGVDTNRFQKTISTEEKLALRHQLGFFDDDFIVVFCGRIIPVKGVLELMQAIVKIDNPKIKLLVIGSSDFGNGNLNDYSKKVRKMSNENVERVVYTGFIDNAELYKYYRISNIGVVPSLCQEAFALVPLEMLNCGLPTIATKVGGMPELLTDETTLFTPFDNHIVDNLRVNIIRLYENNILRNKMSQMALERSRDFTREIYFHNFCAVVEDILNE
ncbi:glycosyltransferase family 4 protein [Prevotella multiformis]|uniref:glycosyltransferase family 4 protein n=1 Tax=Prevotella multiformis TaxID=282402 RepID=UPI0028DB7EE2|nr:glycosyltransferase family 4 protein [Prevotella multiformis]